MRIGARYPMRAPRHALYGVDWLFAKARPSRTPHQVVIVGTNGKTSTATYLSRMMKSVFWRRALDSLDGVFARIEEAIVGARSNEAHERADGELVCPLDPVEPEPVGRVVPDLAYLRERRNDLEQSRPRRRNTPIVLRQLHGDAK